MYASGIYHPSGSVAMKWDHHGTMRRFQLHKWDIENLMRIIREFEPDFNDNLTYIDSDGDQIHFSTTLEMKELLASRGNNPEATVKIKSYSNTEKLACPSTRRAHPCVFCDGCNKDIYGTRYKCVVCDNFDLCETCERTDTHAQHAMLRLVTPDTPYLWLFFSSGAVSRRRELRQAMSVSPVTETAHEIDIKSMRMKQRIKKFAAQLQKALMKMGVEYAVTLQENNGSAIEHVPVNTLASSGVNTTPAEPAKTPSSQEPAGIHQILTNADRDTKLTIKRKLAEGQNSAAAKASKSSSSSVSSENSDALSFSNSSPNATKQDGEQLVRRKSLGKSTKGVNRLLKQEIYSSAFEFESMLLPLVTEFQKKLEMNPQSSNTEPQMQSQSQSKILPQQQSFGQAQEHQTQSEGQRNIEEKTQPDQVFLRDKVNSMLITEEIKENISDAGATDLERVLNNIHEDNNNSGSNNKDDNNNDKQITTTNHNSNSNIGVNNNNDDIVDESIEIVEMDVDVVDAELPVTPEFNDNALSSFSVISSIMDLLDDDTDDEWMIVKKTSYKSLCDFYEQCRSEKLQECVDPMELRDVRVVPNSHAKSSVNNAIDQGKFRALITDMITKLAINYPRMNIDDDNNKNQNNNQNNKENNKNNYIIDSENINNKETAEVNCGLASLSLQPPTSASVMQNAINLKRQEIGENLLDVNSNLGMSPLGITLLSSNNAALDVSTENIPNSNNDNANDTNKNVNEVKTLVEPCYSGVSFYPGRRPHDKKSYIRHPNPTVQKALELLDAMGYDNCNGWLTSLVERYDGDIAEVIDAAEKDQLYQARLKQFRLKSKVDK